MKPNSEDTEESNTQTDKQQDSEINALEEKLDLKEFARDYRVEKKKERSLIPSLLITIAFVLGPITLIIDILIPAAFSFVPGDMTLISGVVTGIFVLAAVIKAKLQAG